MRLLLCVALVVLPGLAGWWMGRRLGREADPLLAEHFWKFRRRLGVLGWSATVGVAVLGGWHAFWLLPCLLAGALAASYAVRRRLLGESWSYPAYAGFTLRLMVGLVGFFLLLATGPMMAGGNAGWAGAAMVAALLASTKAGLPPLRRRLWRLAPWTPEDSELRVALERIHGEAKVPAPRSFRMPVPGGRWPNALALPWARGAWVVMSQTLLESFEPREVAAIYAHEVAHLEEMDVRWARRAARIEWALVAGATAVTYFAPRVQGQLPLTLVWTLLLLVGLSRFAAASRGREERADRRAVELLGDRDALASALLKLHAGSLLPRRWGWEEAKRLTHPSLAHRLRSIRGEEASETEIEQGEIGEPLVVRGRRPGQALILDAERVHRLEETVAEGSDPQALLAAAGSASSERYEQLSELRLEAAGKGYRLAARTRGGGRWRFELPQESGAAVQERLDAIDHRISAPVGARVGFFPGVAVRVLSLIAALLALTPPFSGTVALAAIVTAIFPRAPLLVATGSMGVLAGLMGLRLASGALLGAEFASVAAWALLAASIPLLVAGWGERRGDKGDRGAWITGGVLLLFALPFWAFELGIGWAAGVPLDPYLLHRYARSLGSLALLPLGAAAAFAVGRARRWRLSAAGSLVLALAALWLASEPFRARFAPDPLRLDAAAEAPTRRRLVEREILRLPGAVYQARLAPGGGAFAVSDDYGESATWTIGRPGESARREVESLDLALTTEDGWLFVREDSDEGSRGSLCRGSFAREQVLCGEPIELPVAARLSVDESSWWIWGTEEEDDDLAPSLRVLFGRDLELLGQTRWEVPEAARSGVVEWTPLDERNSLAVVWRMEVPSSFWAAAIATIGRRELWRIGPAGAERVFETRLELSCEPLGPGRPEAVCAAYDDAATSLWRVPAVGEPEPWGAFPGSAWVETTSAPGGVLITGSGEGGILVLGDRPPIRLVLPEDGAGELLAATESVGLARRFDEVDWQEGSTLVLHDVAGASPDAE